LKTGNRDCCGEMCIGCYDERNLSSIPSLSPALLLACLTRGKSQPLGGSLGFLSYKMEIKILLTETFIRLNEIIK